MTVVRKQTDNWRQEHHEKGEGGTEASKYRCRLDLDSINQD